MNKYQLVFLMSSSVTSIFTFKIESTFDEWTAIFDSAEADKRHSEFNIKPLFRGVSKKDPQKVIVIHQAPEGNVQKFLKLMVKRKLSNQKLNFRD